MGGFYGGAASINEFKQTEAARMPALAEQILGLNISEITFHDRESATFGEVYFTVDSGQDQFFCGFDNDRFTGLVIERQSVGTTTRTPSVTWMTLVNPVHIPPPHRRVRPCFSP